MIYDGMYVFLKIRKRPWYVWIWRAVWFLWLLFWAEVAIGSLKELEQKAFDISLIVFLVSFVLGLLLWLWGYWNFKTGGIKFKPKQKSKK